MGLKIYTNELDHMNKMAAMPIYEYIGKISWIFFKDFGLKMGIRFVFMST